MNIFIVALDLHGTLLDRTWSIPVQRARQLSIALMELSDRCRFCLATGNDLEFVHRHVPAPVLEHIESIILETGTVVAEQGSERILVRESERRPIGELDAILRADPPPGVLFFARRLATISLFTRNEQGGADPAGLYPHIRTLVAENGYDTAVTVTHSDVAVDIVPAGYSKYTGLERIAGERPTIGIADSLNDLALIRDTDRAFLPANASPALLDALAAAGREVIPLDTIDVQQGTGTAIGQSRSACTTGVLEILAFLAEYLAQDIGPVGNDRIHSEPE